MSKLAGRQTDRQKSNNVGWLVLHTTLSTE